MKKYIVISMTLLSTLLHAADFQKVKDQKAKDILAESTAAVVSTETGLQPFRTRSLDMMRLMLGSPINTKGVGPAAHAEWSTRLSHQNPIYASTGIGYMIESKPNADGESRNFHQLPIYINLGYTTRLFKGLKAYLGAGPALRQTFERGNALEQNKTYAYGDLMANLGIDYEWINGITGSGQSVGLRASRMFGLANTSSAAPVDALLAGFAFDL